MMTLDHGQPITEALDTLRLTADERTAVLALVHVRTLGDLATVIERKEIADKELAAKLRKLIF